MKKFISLVLAGLFALTLCACQPTPDKPFVESKNDGELEAAIYGTPAPYEPYSAPETWTETFESNDGLYYVNLDAPITIPDVNAYPVYRVTTRDMTSEDVDAFISAFVGDEKIYTAENMRTKDIIEKEIEKIMSGYEPDSHMNQALAAGELSQEEYDYYKKNDEKTMARLREEYKSAPAELELTEVARELVDEEPVDVQLDSDVSLEGYDGLTSYHMDPYFKHLNAFVMRDDTTAKCFSIMSEINAPYGYNQVKYYINNYRMVNDFIPRAFPGLASFTANMHSLRSLDQSNFSGLTISYDEAKEFADSIVHDKLGYSNFEMARVGGSRYDDIDDINDERLDEYMFLYTPVYDGIPMLHYACDAKYGDGLVPMTTPNFMYVLVRDTETYEVYEQAPQEIVKKMSENASLLPFDEIQDIFRRYIVMNAHSSNTFGYTDTEGNLEVDRINYYITDIRLGYVRITEKNNVDYGMLVPAWNFYGYEVDRYIEGLEGQIAVDENREVIYENIANSFLCINALDGSIIDLDSGH